MKALFNKYIIDKNNRASSTLSSNVMSLLDSELSHIEFSGKESETVKMIQRNIYSGGIIEVTKSEGDNMFKESLESDFGPVAIKTDDFKALFYFQDVLQFSFPAHGKEDFILVKGTDKNKRDITGIIACCLYDEVIQLKEVRNGGQKQKIRRSK